MRNYEKITALYERLSRDDETERGIDFEKVSDNGMKIIERIEDVN